MLFKERLLLLITILFLAVGLFLFFLFHEERSLSYQDTQEEQSLLEDIRDWLSGEENTTAPDFALPKGESTEDSDPILSGTSPNPGTTDTSSQSVSNPSLFLTNTTSYVSPFQLLRHMIKSEHLGTNSVNSRIIKDRSILGIDISRNADLTIASLKVDDLRSINDLNYQWPSTHTINGILQNDGEGNLAWATLGASSITPDSLDWSELMDAMTLDTSTDILATSTDYLSITNTGTAYSFRVNDEVGDATPFVIDASGNVGIGTLNPQTQLELIKDTGTAGVPDPVVLRLRSTSSGGVFTDGAWAKIEFYSDDASYGGAKPHAYIGTHYTTASNPNGNGGVSDIVFATTNNSSPYVIEERMRLTRYGSLVIGSTFPFSGVRLEAAIDGGDNTILSSAYGSGSVAQFAAFNANGTQALPTATLSGNTVGAYLLQGYSTGRATGARIAGIAAADWGTAGDATDNPTDIAFSTVVDGSGTLAERMRILSTGNVGIGVTNPTTTLVVSSANTDQGIIITHNNASARQWKFYSGIGGIGHPNFGIADGSDIRIVINNTGRVGIGDTTPASLFTVGNGDLFQVDTNGDIIKLKNLTYSWPSAHTTNGVLTNNGSGTLTWGTLGASNITADSLDFTEFQDQLDLDASTDILATGTNLLSITNTGTGNSFRVNDEASDTTPFVIDAAGNIGIGNTSPDAKLDILSASSDNVPALILDGGGDASGEHVGYLLARNGTAFAGDALRVAANRTANSAFNLINAIIDEDGTPSTAFIVRGDGNVGIGTTSPATTVDILASNNSVRILSGASNALTRFQIGRTASEGDFAVVGSADQFFTGTVPGDIVLRSSGSTNKLFLGNDASTEVVTINSGNVGIGTTTPGTNKLYVAGETKTDGHVVAGFGLWVRGNRLTAGVDVSSMGGTSVGLFAGSAERLSISTAGNIGINDTSPDGLLDIEPTGAVTVASYGINLSNLTTNATTDAINKYGAYITSTGTWTGSAGTATNNYGLYVDTVSGADNNYGAYIAGNVGIGTTGPGEKLDVSGNINVASGGKIGLISNAAIQYTSGNVFDFLISGANRLRIGSSYINVNSSGSYRWSSTGNGDGASDVYLQRTAANTVTLSSDGSTGAANMNILGNVGIGTTSPGAKLTVSGTGATPLQVIRTGSSTNANMQFTNDSGSVYAGIYSTAFAIGPNQDLGSGGSPWLFINAGNVGIGTVSPGSQKLMVEGGATAIAVLFEDDFVSNRYQFTTGGNNLDSYFNVNSDSTRGANIRAISGTISSNLMAGFSRTGIDFAGANFVLRNGTNNIVSVSTGAPADTLFVSGGGNVGIGNISPTYNLEIGAVGGTGNKNIRLNTIGAGFAGIRMMEDAGGGDIYGFSLGLNAGTNNFSILRHDNLQAGTEALTITRNSGNVGIGTTSPGAKLDVFGNTTTTNTAQVGSFGIQSYSDTNAILGLNTYYSGSQTIYRQDGPIAIVQLNSGDIYFRTAASGTAASSATLSDRLIIKNTGNVGIGDTSPASLFTVGSGDLFQVDSSGAVTTTGAVQSGGRIFSTSAVVTTLASTSQAFQAGATATANVAIDTNSLQARNNGSAASLLLNALGGNVGIGTTTPGVPLDVSGEIRGVQFTGYSSGVTRVIIDNGVIGLQLASSRAVTWSSGGSPSTGRDLSLSRIGAGILGIGNGTIGDSTGTLTVGNIGIGTTSPQSKFHISAGAPEIRMESTQTNFNYTNGNSYGFLNFYSNDSSSGGTGQAGYIDLTSDNANGVPSVFRFATRSIGGIVSEKLRLDATGNLGINTTTFGTSAASILAISNSTAPSTSITDGIQLFAVDQAGSHELRVMDEAGNTTTLSPHNFSLIPTGASESLAWSFYSERGNKAVNVDMMRALRLVETLSGESLIYTKKNGEIKTENIGTGIVGALDNVDADISDIQDDLAMTQASLDLLQDQMSALTDFYLNFNLENVLFTDEAGGLTLEGSLQVTTLDTGAVTVRVIDVDAPTIGQATLEAGKTEVGVETKAVGEGSRVFVTPRVNEALSFPLTVTDVTAEESFTISIPEEFDQDIEFDWWLVEEK